MRYLALTVLLCSPLQAQVMPEDVSDAPTSHNLDFLYQEIRKNRTATDTAIAALPGVAGANVWTGTNTFTNSVMTGGGKIRQVVYASRSDLLTGTNTIVFDDSIPQNTEGFEIMTATITPLNAYSNLLVEGSVCFTETSNTGDFQVLCIFRDSTANALACTPANIGAGVTICLHYTVRVQTTADSTNQTFFRLRAGNNVGGLTINGGEGARQFGGALKSTLTVTEIAP